MGRCLDSLLTKEKGIQSKIVALTPRSILWLLCGPSSHVFWLATNRGPRQSVRRFDVGICIAPPLVKRRIRIGQAVNPRLRRSARRIPLCELPAGGDARACERRRTILPAFASSK